VRTLRALGRALGALAHLLAPGARTTALDNVERVYPALSPSDRRAFVRTCFATLGEALGETVALLRPPGARGPALLPVSDEAREVLASARAEGRGVVFASAHLGPWERVAASLVAASIPLVTLARESYDPRFSRLYERLRAAHGVRVVWRATPGAAARIVRTLRDGGVLGVPMDLRARVPSRAVPFLGHDAPTAIGPARIALRTGSAVVVGTAAPRPAGPAGPGAPAGPGEGLAVTATRVDAAGLAADERGARELTARINAELSRRILALPHAWVWMHDRWSPPTNREEEYDGDHGEGA
jgi:KDO2-lipid IV(A) lauroyltransferase